MAERSTSPEAIYDMPTLRALRASAVADLERISGIIKKVEQDLLTARQVHAQLSGHIAILDTTIQGQKTPKTDDESDDSTPDAARHEDAS